MATLASKRKRDTDDISHPRAAPGMGGGDFDDSYLHTDDHNLGHGDPDMGFAAALVQHNTGGEDGADPSHDSGHMMGQEHQHEGGVPSASDTAAAAMAQYHTMTVPQSTEQAFMTQVGDTANDRPASATTDHNGASLAQQRTSSFGGDYDMGGVKDGQSHPNGQGSPPGANSQSQNAKPQVGTDEWHKVRRDNHKEVERRRRETINEGINELAKIVPGCEKNKGSILARAVQFITQLKENETQNIEKWTLEKLLTEQAIAELSSSCDKLKAECQRAWAECEQWKQAAKRAGVSIENEDKKGDTKDSD